MTFRTIMLGMLGMTMTAGLLAQGGPKKAPASPPAEASVTVQGKAITIKYSSPAVRGRQIFGPGGLVSHDATYPVWRAGANAATSLHTDAALTLGTLQVPAGNYTLFVQVQDPEHWVLIVNKQTGQWGLTYDAKQDLGRVAMQMSAPAATVERLKWTLTADSMTLSWDRHTGTVAMKVE